jgi:hypothetical protein
MAEEVIAKLQSGMTWLETQVVDLQLRVGRLEKAQAHPAGREEPRPQTAFEAPKTQEPSPRPSVTPPPVIFDPVLRPEPPTARQPMRPIIAPAPRPEAPKAPKPAPRPAPAPPQEPQEDGEYRLGGVILPRIGAAVVLAEAGSVRGCSSGWARSPA